MGYRNLFWACPYYRWDEPKRIHCDGGTVKAGGVTGLMLYAKRYCTAVPGWEECTLARALTEEYERKEKRHGKRKGKDPADGAAGEDADGQ